VPDESSRVLDHFANLNLKAPESPQKVILKR